MTAPQATGALWRFSLAVYAAPDVPAHCLALQDRDGADVNLILAVAWAGASGRGRLDVAQIARLDRDVAPLRDEVVGVLRGARRWLKPRAADPAASRLRDRLKALELEAERHVQDLLEARLPGLAGTREEPAARLEAAIANVQAYLRHLGAAGQVGPIAPAVATWISTS